MSEPTKLTESARLIVWPSVQAPVNIAACENDGCSWQYAGDLHATSREAAQHCERTGHAVIVDNSQRTRWAITGGDSA